MEGKILSTLIENGKITPHLAIFMQTAFSYSPSSIHSTVWIPLSQYQGGFIKNRIVKNALVKKGLDAITLNREVIYASDLYSQETDGGFKSWMELIVHEQFHRQEIEKFGWVYWYARYGWESLRYGYRNAPSEKRAYAVAMGSKSKMEMFLNSEAGKEWVAICQNERWTQEEKNEAASEIARRYFSNASEVG